MKNLKKVLSLILALAMVLGMTITGFAADETTPTFKISVPSDKDSHTYSVYQIFTGDLADGKLSNVVWGQNGSGTEGADVPAAVLDELTKVDVNASDTAKLAVINKYADVSGTAFETGLKHGTDVEVPAGYYLIKDESAVAADDAATLYIVKVVGPVQITRKAGVPHVDKEIVEGDALVKANSTSIGKEVPYQITGYMPDRIDDYNTYFYKFNDTLSKGLTYNEEKGIKVELVNENNRVDVTKYFYKHVSEYNATTGTTIEVSIKDILQLRNAGLTVNDKTTVVISYSAILNEDALIVVDGNPNTVEVIYSNNPNDSGEPTPGKPEEEPPTPPTPEHPTGVTPKDEVITYTTELTILKTDEKDQFLPGTEFTLTGEGVKVALVTTTEFKEDPAGKFYKLKNGTYTTAVPSTEDRYETRTAGDLTVRGTVEVPIYILENGEYKEVKSVPAKSTYYVKLAASTADYESIDTKYSAETSVVAKGAGKTETNVKGTVGTDGKVTFTGLGAGKYTLTETKTMPGYNTIKPIDFEITFNADTKKFASNNNTINVEVDNTLSAAIVNKSGSVLPTTGGMGTTLFYLFGSILVLGAGVLLFTRKRMAR